MSNIDHPGHKDEQVKLGPITLLFAISNVIAFVGMFLVMIWNHQGGF
jgi:hypothetical protein